MRPEADSHLANEMKILTTLIDFGWNTKQGDTGDESGKQGEADGEYGQSPIAGQPFGGAVLLRMKAVVNAHHKRDR